MSKAEADNSCQATTTRLCSASPLNINDLQKLIQNNPGIGIRQYWEDAIYDDVFFGKKYINHYPQDSVSKLIANQKKYHNLDKKALEQAGYWTSFKKVSLGDIDMQTATHLIECFHIDQIHRLERNRIMIKNASPSNSLNLTAAVKTLFQENKNQVDFFEKAEETTEKILARNLHYNYLKNDDPWWRSDIETNKAFTDNVDFQFSNLLKTENVQQHAFLVEIVEGNLPYSMIDLCGSIDRERFTVYRQLLAWETVLARQKLEGNFGPYYTDDFWIETAKQVADQDNLENKTLNRLLVELLTSSTKDLQKLTALDLKRKYLQYRSENGLELTSVVKATWL
jgi:hypothetical protein